MKLLFLKHKTIKPYENELNEEYRYFRKWLEKLGILYVIDYKDFDDELEYQEYNNNNSNINSLYALSQNFMKKMSGKYETPGEYHIIYFLHAPTHSESNKAFTTHYWNDFNGSVCVDMPISEEFAKRPDNWVWRAFAHETIHAFFGILRNAWKINITDYLDQACMEYKKSNPKATEEEMTLICENVYHNSIEPYKDKLFADLPIKGIATTMIAIIGILNSIVEILKKKLEASKIQNREDVINRLAKTIAKQEGFYVKGSLAKRNNNHGNLVYVGQKNAVLGEKGFAKFMTEEDGWNALYSQLNYIWDGKSKYYTTDMNISEFVDVWASTSPLNERKAYANAIANEFNTSINTKLKDL